MDEKGNFREDNFAKLREAFGADEGGNEGKAAALIGSNGKLGGFVLLCVSVCGWWQVCGLR